MVSFMFSIRLVLVYFVELEYLHGRRDKQGGFQPKIKVVIVFWEAQKRDHLKRNNSVFRTRNTTGIRWCN